MATKKQNFQKELAKFVEQAKGGFKKFGKELSILAKRSEKKMLKVSRAGKIQMDIVGLGMQKEKLYYDIGKRSASLRTKKELNMPELEPYWKKLRKLETETREKKRELSIIQKAK